MNGAPNIDTSVRLPRQVQKQHARALKLEREIKQPKDPNQPDPSATATAAPGATGAPAPATPATTTAATTPAAPEPKGPAATTAAPAAVPAGNGHAPDDKGTIDYYRNRYDSVQGVLRAERMRHAEELAHVSEELANAKIKVAELESAGPASAPKLEEYFTAEQIDALGEERARDMLNLSHKMVTAEVSKRVEAATKPLREAAEKRRTEATAEAEAEARRARKECLDELTRQVPNWVKINEAATWRAWLAEDEGARQSRIDNALGVNDPMPIVRLLREFVALQPPPAVEPGAKPPVLPASNGAGGQATVATEIDPAQMVTRSEITKFYTDIAKNRKLTDSQREERKAAFEVRVKATQAAGLLR